MSKPTQKFNSTSKLARSKIFASFSYFLQKSKFIAENIKKSLNPGLINKNQVKILVLACLIALISFMVLFKQNYSKIFLSQINHATEKSQREIEKENLKKDLYTIVKGHPIESMIPYIAQKDRKTAAYLIGIAKKESNWGERRPVLSGTDCYNYWGFRLLRDRMGSGGHTCFDSPREAVDIVSRRITEIIAQNEVKSAKDMLVWKCGSNCALTGGRAAATKWARDVDYYTQKLLN